MRTQYLITKREPCTALSEDEHLYVYCGQCQGRGYLESQVDLVDVLRAAYVPHSENIRTVPLAGVELNG